MNHLKNLILLKLYLGNVAQDGSIRRETAVVATETGDIVKLRVGEGWGIRGIMHTWRVLRMSTLRVHHISRDT